MSDGIKDAVSTFIAVIVTLAIIVLPIRLLAGIRWESSEQNVSGVVYNVKNNEWISGNTSFSIRASIDTVVTDENKSSFCLPPNSPYISLVNEASENKDIKVVVKTSKVFKIVDPFTCVDNVTVTKVK